ncbi:MAG TPA: pitrilysin family protein [Bacteroidales bacterium]|jgi:zinc protease|nr:pitrilysin family protein [Bacteroidales bacterium]
MKKRLFFQSGIVVLALFLLATCKKAPTEKPFTIEYEKYSLPNGLEVVLHQDTSDPIVSTAIMYHVGSSREEPGKTGFAHLFEHMLFQESENIPQDQFFRKIQNVGGTLNGFTNNDVTTYFEVVPKNALELVLWMESDRMGFFINTVTQNAFAVQQNVVQNEKRQGVDNVPYGHTDYVIDKNLFPEGHPYNWQVIGEMADLQKATVEDVRAFYDKFYGPNNATLVLAGDFDKDSVKTLVEKYFGEIKPHGEVAVRQPMPVVLPESKRLFHEDNFATVPEITIVWPSAEEYNKDSYALTYLARILAEGKKAPMYRVLVKDKQLTSETNAFNYTMELAGRFTMSMRANEGKSLAEIESGVKEAFKLFEEEGITQKDIDRVRALVETDFYNGINNVFIKSLQLAFYNTFTDNPGFIEQDLANYKNVTIEDVMRVYNTYIKDKPMVVTSFVPRGKQSLMAENSVPAGVVEESITSSGQVKIENVVATNPVEKTSSAIDRSKEPEVGSDPLINVPEIWSAELSNGLKVRGIQHDELPLVTFELAIDGGFYLDDPSKPGAANLITDMMPEGTKNKTPEQLEEEIELLGANINWYTTREEIVVNANCLSRNFTETLALVEEMLLQPRWDSTQFELAKVRTINQLEQREADPQYLAQKAFYKLLYGDQHIFSNDIAGTKETVAEITIDDLKAYYNRCFSPSVSRFNIAGNVTRDEVTSALNSLEENWKKKEVEFPEYTVPEGPQKSTIYFINVPGAKQSVIYAGRLSVPRTDPNYFALTVMNYKLGGSFSGNLNLILREEKGFTYGARSSFSEMKNPAPFFANSSVRSDATFESVGIFKKSMEDYRNGISDEEMEFTRNSLVKSNLRRFETINNLLSMLSAISKYNLPEDYVLKEEKIVREMTVDQHKSLAQNYIKPDQMIYVIAGDADTQLKPLERIGYGKPVMLNN